MLFGSSFVKREKVQAVYTMMYNRRAGIMYWMTALKADGDLHKTPTAAFTIIRTELYLYIYIYTYIHTYTHIHTHTHTHTNHYVYSTVCVRARAYPVMWFPWKYLHT
jgi:hypothetical protein